MTDMNYKNKLMGLSLILLAVFSACSDEVENGGRDSGTDDHRITFAVGTKSPDARTRADDSLPDVTESYETNSVEMQGKLDGKTVYLTAEVCMTRGIDDVDFCIFIKDCRVFGKNRDSTFSFDGIGVHDTFSDFLVCAENAALFQELVHKSRFTVVYMSNNRNVTHIFSFHKISFLSRKNLFYLYVYQFTTNPVYHIFSGLQGAFEKK